MGVLLQFRTLSLGEREGAKCKGEGLQEVPTMAPHTGIGLLAGLLTS